MKIKLIAQQLEEDYPEPNDKLYRIYSVDWDVVKCEGHMRAQSESDAVNKFLKSLNNVFNFYPYQQEE
jgi:hypothetical protein